MAVLTSTSVDGRTGGIVIPFVAASAGGDRVPIGGRSYLLVRNASASSINVTVDTTGLAFNGVAIPDTVVAVAAGATTAIPLTGEYAAVSDGLAAVTYSATATVTVAAVTF